MLFNSLEFAVFLPIVFCIYWFLAHRNLRIQNAFLLVASYIFYGWWDWRFLALIVISSSLDYFVGIGLGRSNNEAHRKRLLLSSVLINIGLLAFFKYFNFFAENFYAAFTFFGQPVADPFLLKVILPIGISFYTFQSLSYSIDCYRRKLEPTKDIVAFFAFVSFFPQLVAGPIERARNLLPQFKRSRKFDYENATDGMRQILWGLFKKIVIADNCAVYANDIFLNYEVYSGSTLMLGAVFFAFQIYCDFSGYSDIAIGTARLFGFNLMRNFAFPYFSRDIAEFWRRWHISLSTWFRDYVYIPLGGSRGGTLLSIRNLFIVFIVSGFWHGANWTFIAWGVLNTIYIIPLVLMNRNRINTNTIAEGKLLPSIKETVQMGLTFLLTSFAWVFFRSESVGGAFAYFSGIFSASLISVPEVLPMKIVFLILFLVSAEWFQRNKQHALQIDKSIFPRMIRWVGYYVIIGLILVFGGNQQEFIYFQF